ncbi:hypothetical protein EVAR_89482_1 [Eumeta japonica]|uniref:Uncharacterized protein n=1 Tax=Eumeta variegata TaxID=151549 RepID=A0A4C1XLW7_EUMVA|nr:hypothetical protein EVAR_89482_1 [Eumeta japonica]
MEDGNKDERYLETVSPPQEHRHVADDLDRDVKRRKIESSSGGKVSKEDDRSPDKEKRKAGKLKAEERKERKMNRKRDRTEESLILDQKRRRDEQKVDDYEPFAGAWEIEILLMAISGIGFLSLIWLYRLPASALAPPKGP